MEKIRKISTLDKILIYPIKSLDGVSLSHSKILPSGSLKYDRKWAIFDEKGKFVNGKRNHLIYQLRATFNENLSEVSLNIEESNLVNHFHLNEDNKELEAYLSKYFGFSVYLKENAINGFPDDTYASGPTIISTATLETIAGWFPNLTVEEIRRRLRANLEISGVPAFWEDQLFADKNQWVNFKIGDIEFQGINPCQRCIVPTKNSYTGEITSNFQQQFIKKRKETLPPWINSSQFNHFYRVSVNTKVSQLKQETPLNIGDEVQIMDN